MRYLLKSMALGALIAGSSGCVYLAATPSVQGKAYVVKTNFFGIFGSTFWNCDATSGEPTCYQTHKVMSPAAAK